MINIQYFRTAQDIKDAYGDNVPSNVVCVAGNNDSVLINTSNNNPHSDKEEQDKPTIVNKINNLDLSVSPAKWPITLKPDDKHTGLGTVTVNAVTSSIDSNIQPENIKQGVSILGVEGTFTPKFDSITINPTTNLQSFTAPEGFDGYDEIIVEAVTSSIDSNIQPGNIKQGVSILGIEGTLTEGAGGDTPNYSYMKGTADREGLRAIGWTDEDILTYEQNTPPHYSWQNDQFKVSDENKALYLLEDPTPSSYTDNPNITFVPNKNMGSYFANSNGFGGMYNIKGIPFYDTSNVTDMNFMFSGCANLTTIPQLNTSNVTNMSSMFSECSNLAAIPQLDTSNVTDMSGMFSECSNLAAISQLNTSNVTNMNYMFDGCSKLTTIPQLNTSNVTSMWSMFNGCNSLTSIPELNTSNVTDMNDMFYNCNSLTTIPQLNTSNVTDMNNMFSECHSITSAPQLNTSNVTNMSYMFNNCQNLTTIPQLDTSNATGMVEMLGNCKNLTTVEGIDFSGLTSDLNNLFAWTSNMPKLTHFIVNGKINVSISDDFSIKALDKIDYDSVKSILAAANRTDNTNEKTLAFNRTIADQNGELAALVTSCTSKGWVITGLTIQ